MSTGTLSATYSYSNEDESLMDVSRSLIGSIVFYGNCIRSLDKKLITCFELMDYIVENKSIIPYPRLLYCYFSIVSFFPTEYQYVNNRHFTWYFKEDILMMRMYCRLVKNLDLFRDKDNTDDIMLWEYMGDHLFNLSVVDDTNDILGCLLNVDRISTNKNLLSQYPWLIECIFLFRAEELYHYCYQGKDKSERDKKIIENYIKSDQVDELSSEEIISCLDLYTEFVYKIKTKCPLYFHKMKDVYCKILHHTPISKLEVLEISKIKNLLKLSSNGYMNAYDLPDEYIRLAIYPIQCLSYILGFDILYEIPSYEQIQNALNELVKLGPEEYVKSKLRSSDKDDRIINDMDSLCEDPNDYLPFDRYNLIHNNKIYQFTRPEFNKLIDSNQNFYTHCELPLYSKLTLIQRNYHCSQLSLPRSDTQLHLLEKGIEGKLYQIPEQEKKENEEQEQTINIPMNQLRTQLLSSLLMNMIPITLNE